MRKALARPNAKVWYTAPYYRQAKDIAWQLIFEIVPRELIARTNESELWVEFLNGSRIYLKGCDLEDSLVGVGLDFIVPDEYALYKPHVWPKILRPMLTDTGGGALFIGTPRGKNSFWELWLKGQRNEEGWASWQFPTISNPFIEESEIEEAKKTLPERLYRQEYLASFEDYSGMVWPEFQADKHVIRPYAIPEHWTRIGAIDTAMSGVTAALKCAVGDGDSLVIYDEYYERDKRASEVAEAIRAKDVQWWIDPSSAARNTQREGKLYSLFDEYRDHGIYPRAAENDVDAGINRVAEYFKRGDIQIFSTCKNLIWELERYHWSDERETIGGTVKPKPFKKDDHAVDCLRYIVMSRSVGGSMKEEINPDSAWGRLMRHRKENASGKPVYSR